VSTACSADTNSPRDWVSVSWSELKEDQRVWVRTLKECFKAVGPFRVHVVGLRTLVTDDDRETVFRHNEEDLLLPRLP
jgi:hypothetical protein